MAEHTLSFNLRANPQIKADFENHLSAGFILTAIDFSRVFVEI